MNNNLIFFMAKDVQGVNSNAIHNVSETRDDH